MEEGTFPCTLSGSIAEAPQIKPTKDRIAREKKTEFICACNAHTRGRNSMWTIQQVVRIWVYTPSSVSNGERRKGTFGEINDFWERCGFLGELTADEKVGIVFH